MKTHIGLGNQRHSPREIACKHALRVELNKAQEKVVGQQEEVVGRQEAAAVVQELKEAGTHTLRDCAVYWWYARLVKGCCARLGVLAARRGCFRGRPSGALPLFRQAPEHLTLARGGRPGTPHWLPRRARLGNGSRSACARQRHSGGRARAGGGESVPWGGPDGLALTF